MLGTNSISETEVQIHISILIPTGTQQDHIYWRWAPTTQKQHKLSKEENIGDYNRFSMQSDSSKQVELYGALSEHCWLDPKWP